MKVNDHLLPLVAKLPPDDPPDDPLDDGDGAGGAADGDWAFCAGARGDEAGGASALVGVATAAVTVTTLVLQTVVVVGL